MEIEQLKERKEKLENQILALVKEFEIECECVVADIQNRKLNEMSGKVSTAYIRVTVEI